jgi:ketosteroid isomerase-like protein
MTSSASTSGDVVQAYLTAMEHKDKAELLAVLADDAILEMPLDVAGTNQTRVLWRGADGASTHYGQAFVDVESIKFTEVDICPTTDPDVVFAEAVGDMAMVSGRPYNNRYVFRFDLRDGKIRRIREYCNPVTSALSYGIPLPAQ